MKKAHIVVVGSVNTDMVVFDNRIPRPGETVTGGRFVMVPGGKGANQAVAAARLGADVTLVAKVGIDLLGTESIENFQEEKIQTDQILRDPDEATGVALILVDPVGENSISVAPGANFALTPEEVEQAFSQIDQVDVVLLQLEIPLEVVRRAAELAHQRGATVVLDPAPAPAPSPAGATKLDRALLEKIDCLTPNETEAEILTGIPVTDQTSAQRAADALLAQGARRVILTLGGNGSLLAEADQDQKRFIPARPVEPVDTTAAGDAYNGGLASALAEGFSYEEAVARASAVGALAVTRLGAQTSLPTKKELDTFETAE